MQACIAARHGTTLAQNGWNMPRADEQPPRTDSLARTIPPQYGERGQALDDGQQRAERSRKPHGKQCVGEQPRGDIRARNAHQHNRQRVVHERKVRFLAGAEVAAEAEIHARENAVPDIAAQVLAAEQHDAAVPGEHGDNLLRRKKDDDGNRRRIQKRPPRPLLLARAEVLGAQRRDGGKHGRRNKEQHADAFFHDADRSRIVKPAPVREHGYDDERDLYESVLHGDRNADFQDVRRSRLLQNEVAFLEPDSVLPPQNHGKGDGDAHRLRKRRAESRAQRSQPDEQVVKRDVEDARDGDKVHRAFCVAKPALYGADDIVRGYERNSHEAHHQVANRSHGGLPGSRERAHNLPREQQHRRQHCRHQHED